MKFHVVVMQYTGDITDRGEQSLARLRNTGVGRQLIAGFEMMLEEHLPQLLEGMVSIDLPVFDGQRGRLVWRQPDVFSASAAFFIDGKMKFTWLLFAGHDPVADDFVVEAAADFIRNLAAGAGMALHPDRGLRSIRERPVAICIPWPPTPSDLDRKLVGNMATCLAAAFFRTADLVAERGLAAWEGSQKWVRNHNLDGVDN
jgi:hypothetical protein